MKTGSTTQGTSFTKEMAPVMWYSTLTFRTCCFLCVGI